MSNIGSIILYSHFRQLDLLLPPVIHQQTNSMILLSQLSIQTNIILHPIFIHFHTVCGTQGTNCPAERQFSRSALFEDHNHLVSQFIAAPNWFLTLQRVFTKHTAAKPILR
jgi:hypothetical protein